METIVLYPSPGMGHLISMVELGKFIIKHTPNFSIAILTVAPSFNTGSTTAYISKISTQNPSIKFHHLPQIPLNLDSHTTMESILFDLLNLANPHVHTSLKTINNTSKISAFVIDLFCTASLTIAKELDIPTYYFYTSGASVLAFCLYFPQIHKSTSNKSLKDMKNTLLEVPGVSPKIPACDAMKPLLDREAQDFNGMFQFCSSLPNCDGVLVNSFETLETGAVEAIRAGQCNPDGIIKTPPIFCVGPLLAEQDRVVDHDCLKWLDLQPVKSVVFLSFGSLGLFSGEQLKEIAVGLERSGCRFLWTVRSPPEKGRRFLPPPEPELDAILPAGFLERTKDRGFVVKSWAPQVAVLRHQAVGGFVTHCGWNSVLEAVVAGVPMIAWPLYAEQHHNRWVMVEEMKVALRINESEEDGFVAAEEVERSVKELMDSESEKAKEVRKVVEQRSEEAKAAMSEGGSSIAALARLAQLWKRS